MHTHIAIDFIRLNGDPRVRLADLAARAVFIYCLPYLLHSEPPGRLQLQNLDFGRQSLARLIGAPESEVGVCLNQLTQLGLIQRHGRSFRADVGFWATIPMGAPSNG